MVCYKEHAADICALQFTRHIFLCVCACDRVTVCLCAYACEDVLVCCLWWALHVCMFIKTYVNIRLKKVFSFDCLGFLFVFFLLLHLLMSFCFFFFLIPWKLMVLYEAPFFSFFSFLLSFFHLRQIIDVFLLFFLPHPLTAYGVVWRCCDRVGPRSHRRIRFGKEQTYSIWGTAAMTPFFDFLLRKWSLLIKLATQMGQMAYITFSWFLWCVCVQIG